jgi:spore germination cell wall hydrolase CwlJ-like protein
MDTLLAHSNTNLDSWRKERGAIFYFIPDTTRNLQQTEKKTFYTKYNFNTRHYYQLIK